MAFETAVVQGGYLTVNRLFVPEPEGEIVSRLRGADVLRILMQPRYLGETMEMIEPAANGVSLVNHGIVFGDLSLAPSRIFEHDMIKDLPLILDVHFPFFDPDHIFTMGPGANEDANEASQQFWSHPIRQQLCWDLVRRAHVVTTPHELWADRLSEVNDHVILLPDTTDARSAEQFARVFMYRIFDETMTSFMGASRRRSWLMKFLMRMSLPMYWLTDRRKLLKEFEKIDWEITQ